jgi:hypothetical protein
VTRTRVAIAAVSLLLAGATTATLVAQRRFGFRMAFDPDPNAKYDGRFTFARLKYNVAPAGYYYCGLPSWAHGYASCRGGQRAERSLMQIMSEVSYLGAHVEDSVVLAIDDPELFKYPVAYMTEASYWETNDAEAAAFRAYLQKGGFVIFDDFRDDFGRGSGGWQNFAANMGKVLPGVRFYDLDASHPIFHSFFEIDSFDIIPQSYDFGRPILRGIFEDNDPKKRLMAIVNFDTDISDFWEFSATGFRPIDESNQAYKLGVNYIMYGMTH